MSYSLSEFLSGETFSFLLIFMRIAAAVMLLPGYGETYVNAKMRLAIILGLTLVTHPLLSPLLPPAPASPTALVLLLMSEALFGSFLALLARSLMSALETAGSIIAIQIGLSNAQVFNPALAAQSTLPSAFLGAAGVVILFVSGLHHLLLVTVVESYQVYMPGAPLNMQDMAGLLTHFMAESFRLGVQIAAPFLVIGLALMVGMGLLARLAQQIPVFFIGLPLQIALGLYMFAVVLSSMLLLWQEHFRDTLQSLPDLF